MADEKKAPDYIKEAVEKARERMKASKSPQEAARIMAECMPDEIRQQLKENGGAYDNDSIVAAALFASVAGERLMAELFLLLISKPDHNHEAKMMFPSLRDIKRTGEEAGIIGPKAEINEALEKEGLKVTQAGASA